MKITSAQLRQLIKEEVQKVLLEYEQSVFRRGDDLFVVDDEGNEDYYDSAIGSEFEYLEDGESAPLERGSYGGGGGYGRSSRRRRW